MLGVVSAYFCRLTSIVNRDRKLFEFLITICHYKVGWRCPVNPYDLCHLPTGWPKSKPLTNYRQIVLKPAMRLDFFVN